MRNSFLTRVLCCSLLLILTTVASPTMAQETTGGVQGTVRDSSGAVVPSAQITLTSPTLIGRKTATTDSSGYYRFANLPPGIYTLTATAKGFSTTKRDGLNIEVGRLPSVDLNLTVGATESVVEVTSEAPLIDLTTSQTINNITNDVVNNVPHGLTYQSVIQFAPMARNEPLSGQVVNGQGAGGTGGSLPGSSGNGQQFGYSIGGAADSENSYLVEGQDTEQLSGGYSKANVPFQFIQEVQLKTSGIQAEYGGALGGVVNVVMKKGSNAFHGQIFSTYSGDGIDGNNNQPYLRYDPNDAGNAALRQDPASQLYSGKKDSFRTIQPGFNLGGPIIKNRLWFFVGAAPELDHLAKTVDFGGTTGKQNFQQERRTYFANGRLDAALTSKIRAYASWLYQYAWETGDSLPISDPVKSEAGYLNTSTQSPLSSFDRKLGWSAPNATYNFGADITLTQKIVSTTRFGYFFENYHDFGWQTTTPNLVWQTNGVGAVDNNGNPLPASLQQPAGSSTAPYTSTFTQFNANKHYQFNQDVAFFKGGWWGTHNIKVGYQLNHLVNVISQNGNVPFAFIYAGNGLSYSPSTTNGGNTCTTLSNQYGGCTGLYGYVTAQDFATVLASPASDWNHALFLQDSWTVGHGLTLNLGIRVEKESLPAPGGVNVPSINFSWTDKIAPRLGAAWDPTGTGRMKIFGSYGVVNDVMKLLLAQTSWGAQAYEDCTYPLGPDGTAAGFNVSDINLVFKGGRACPSGPTNLGANFASSSTPAALTDPATKTALVENVNFRPAEPVAPGVKPYRQHEYVAGFDFKISNNWALEARYDRRRLDHVIEDASLADPVWGETYAIVNPGEGVNKTINGYASYLQSIGEAFLVPGWAFNADPTAPFGTCNSCPPMPKAIRNYDGFEIRVTKSASKGFAGMFSYTYSRLWGNYTGLTTTDQSDGNTAGRNSPDTTRAFDEPFYYFGANGKSTNGLLPTDRPNTFKGYGYYTLPWKGGNTTFGLFQYAYQGTPISTYVDLAAMFAAIPYEATYIFGRGQWSDVTTDAAGNLTLGAPHMRRTPWYTQTDFQVAHTVKVTEGKSLRFEANATNLWNQHAIVQYYQGFNSANFERPLKPGGLGLFSGAALYQTLESAYDPQQWVNAGSRPIIKSSWYGQPQQFQLSRNFRLGVTFTF